MASIPAAWERYLIVTPFSELIIFLVTKHILNITFRIWKWTLLCKSDNRIDFSQEICIHVLPGVFRHLTLSNKPLNQASKRIFVQLL